MRLRSRAGVARQLLVLVLFTLLSRVNANQENPGERHYYVAAVLIDWNYSGNGQQRSGPSYKKVVFREYDEGFQQAKTHPSWLGLVGPTLKGQEGETLVVTFRNMADRPYSVNPRGIAYGKQSEGALYFDNTSQKEKEDDVVHPNGQHTYYWELTADVAPQEEDPDCLTYTYSSHFDVVKDYNSGLIGTLLVCKSGHLDESGEQIQFDQEYMLLFGVFDESNSWYRPKDSSKDSLVKHTINGYTNGSLPDVEVCAHSAVSLHLAGMSSEADLFSVHVNGQVLQHAGHRVSSVGLISGTATSASLHALHAGRWLLSSHTTKHMEAGLHGYVDVQLCEAFEAPKRKLTIKEKLDSKEWTYYLAAEEVTWDYAPNMPQYIDEDYRLQYLKQGPHRIGGRYKKAVYTQYEDETFTVRKGDMQRKKELGILGPVIRAQIRDVIKIVFKNMASRPYSIYPHGVYIEKEEEGANYPAGGNQTRGVLPGDTHTYTWNVLLENEPLDGDPRCVTRMYHSAVDTPRDIASGLVGPLLICKGQSLNVRNVQLKADKEQHAMFAVFDENKSWYLDSNIQTYCDPSKVNKEEPDFYKSNVMHSINGYVFESGQRLGFCYGEIATWHVSSVGAQDYIQTATFYGHPFDLNDRTEDYLSLFPMTGETISMNMDNVGFWLLASLNSHESTKGMRILFSDVDCYRETYEDVSEEDRVGEAPQTYSEWKPQDLEEIAKEKETTAVAEPDHQGAPDDDTMMYADMLGLRTLSNRSTDMELLDLSYLDADFVTTPGGGDAATGGGPRANGSRPKGGGDARSVSGAGSFRGDTPALEPNLTATVSSNRSHGENSSHALNHTSAGALRLRLSNAPEDVPENRTVDNNMPLKQSNSSVTSGDVSLPGLRNATLNSTENATHGKNTSPQDRGTTATSARVEGPRLQNASVARVETAALRDNGSSKGSDAGAEDASLTVCVQGNDTPVPQVNGSSEPEDVDQTGSKQTTEDRVEAYEEKLTRGDVFFYIEPPPVEPSPESPDSTEEASLDLDAEAILGPGSGNATEMLGDQSTQEGNLTVGNDSVPALELNENTTSLTTNVTDRSNVAINETGQAQHFSGFKVTALNTTGGHLLVATIREENGNDSFEVTTPVNSSFNANHTRAFVLNPSFLTVNATEKLNIEIDDTTHTLNSTDDEARELNITRVDNLLHAIIKEIKGEIGNYTLNSYEFATPGNSSFNADNTSVSENTAPKNTSASSHLNSSEESSSESGENASSASHGPVNTTSTENAIAYYGSSESREEVVIYLQNDISEGLHAGSLDSREENWGYDSTHQTVPMPMPDHMTKYIVDGPPRTTPGPGPAPTVAPTRKVKRVHHKERPDRGHGVKTKKKKEYKPQPRTSVAAFQPRGFRPGMSPRGSRPQHHHGPQQVSSGEDLMNEAIVIGVPRPDFSDYEVYVAGGAAERLQDTMADEAGEDYEYVAYKDPYGSAEDIKNFGLDQTAEYYLKMAGKNTKTYFITAEEVAWDYAGYGQRRHEKDSDARTTKFKKVVFRGYLDSTFSSPDLRGEKEEHLGILGPVIKAEVGQTIMVFFRNLASRPYSLHPNGVSYTKLAEGLNYEDNSKYWYEYDNQVQPNTTFTYVWKVSEMAGPVGDDLDCRTWAYYSGVNPERDINSGLIGPLLVCREGVLSPESSTVATEFILLFMTFDESKSWYYPENRDKIERMSRLKKTEVTNASFKENLKFHAINGIIFSLKGLRMYSNQQVRWHLFNMGSPKDLHSIYFHGQTFLRKQNVNYRQAVFPLLPGSFATLEMWPSKPGLWQLETEVGALQQKGMQTLFLVLDNVCQHPLGLESGSVKDSQITAANKRGYWEAHLARLNNQGKYNAWSSDVPNSWIQVDFQRPVVISQVATQGAKQLFQAQYVVNYTVSYSHDRKWWIYYKGDSIQARMMFTGNRDANTMVTNTFYPPIIGRYVRLHPIHQYNTATLRMEFYGCELDGCSVPLGMKSGLIEDAQITASSTASSWYSGPWLPSLARLDTQGTVNAWQAKHNDMSQWLQVELPQVKKITGIVTQGAKAMGKEMYVTSYALDHSQDGVRWTRYTDDEDQVAKTFPGNADNNGHVKNYIYPPIFSRFIRIIPKTWKSTITIRMELLGCDFE